MNVNGADEAYQDIIIGLCGLSGSGCSYLISAIENNINYIHKKEFNVKTIKPSNYIREFLGGNSNRKYEISELQKGGNDYRRTTKDRTILARRCLEEIYNPSHEKNDTTRRTIYIIDSLKNTGEVDLLRSVYGDAFYLLAISCDRNIRKRRLMENKYKDIINDVERERKVKSTIQDDEKSGDECGQQCREVFEMADYYIDNSIDRHIPNGPLDRFMRLVCGSTDLIRPAMKERGMYYAFSARYGSAHMSRQIGAAILSPQGDLISVGYNEVPKAGGGVYSEDDGIMDKRDFKKGEDYNKGQLSDIKKQIKKSFENTLVEVIPDRALKNVQDLFSTEIGKTSIEDLTEYGRTTHSEMEALLSALRQGKSVVGAALFVTTFPCHNCMRHIIGSGIDKVYYVEAYPKSHAYEMYEDEIILGSEEYLTDRGTDQDWYPPSKERRKQQKRVAVLAYTGVSQRMYRRAFEIHEKLVDEQGSYKNDMIKSLPKPRAAGIKALERQALLFHSTGTAKELTNEKRSQINKRLNTYERQFQKILTHASELKNVNPFLMNMALDAIAEAIESIQKLTNGEDLT